MDANRQSRPCCRMFAHGPARVKHELLHVYTMRLRPRTSLQQGIRNVSASSESSQPSHPNQRFKIWLRQFEQLRAFAVARGHAAPSLKKEPLGRWAELQRKLYKKGRLFEERKSMLKTVGFCFDAREACKIRLQVERRQRVLSVLASSGRARLTRSSNKDQTRQQRENAALLKEMGSAWGHNFERLKEHKTRHGHPHVIVAQRGGKGKVLGSWANKQRVAFRQGRLSKDRELLLDSIGFCFDGTLASDLREQVLLLKAHRSTVLGLARNLSTATSKQIEALTQRANEAAEAFEADERRRAKAVIAEAAQMGAQMGEKERWRRQQDKELLIDLLNEATTARTRLQAERQQQDLKHLMDRMKEAEGALEYAVRCHEQQQESLQVKLQQSEILLKQQEQRAFEAAQMAARFLQQARFAGEDASAAAEAAELEQLARNAVLKASEADTAAAAAAAAVASIAWAKGEQEVRLHRNIQEAEGRAVKTAEEWWAAGLKARRLGALTPHSYLAHCEAMVMQRDVEGGGARGSSGSVLRARSVSPLSSNSKVDALGSSVTSELLHRNSGHSQKLGGAERSADMLFTWQHDEAGRKSLAPAPAWGTPEATSADSSCEWGADAAEGMTMSADYASNMKLESAHQGTGAFHTLGISVHHPNKPGLVYARPQSDAKQWHIEICSELCIPHGQEPSVESTHHLAVVLWLNQVQLGTWKVTPSMLALRNATGHLPFIATFPALCEGYCDLRLFVVREDLPLLPSEDTQPGILPAVSPQDVSMDANFVTNSSTDTRGDLLGLDGSSLDDAPAVAGSPGFTNLTVSGELVGVYYCEMCDIRFQTKSALGGHCSRSLEHKQRMMEVRHESGVLASFSTAFRVRTITLPPHSSIAHFEGGIWAEPLRVAHETGLLQALLKPRSTLGRRDRIKKISASLHCTSHSLLLHSGSTENKGPYQTPTKTMSVYGHTRGRVGRPKRTDKCWVFGHEIDVAQLVSLVDTMGGAATVTAKRQWRFVARELGVNFKGKTRTGIAKRLSSVYIRALQARVIEEKNQVSESADGALAPGAELLPLQDLPHSGKADMLHRYVGGKEIDLRELVKLVQRKGGPMAVSRCRSWVQLAHQLGASEGRTDLSRSTSSRMKSFYHYAVKELEMRNITVLDLTDAARSEATAEDKTLRRVGGNDIIFTVFKLKCNSCKKEYEPTTDDIKPSHPNSFQPSEYFKACSSCRKYKKNYAKNYRVVVGGAITSRRRGRPRKEEKKFYCPKTIPLPASDVSWPFGGGEAQGVSYCNRGMAIEHWPLVGEHSGEGWGGGGGGEGFRGVETLNMLPQNSEAGCSGFFGLSPYAPPERAAGLWGGGNDHFVPASWLPPPMEAGTGLEGLSSSVFCTWPPTQEKS